MLVLDASALASWLMPDELGIDLIALATRHDVLTAPWLIWAEIRNILVVNEQRGRIGSAVVDQALEIIGQLGIVLDTGPSSSAVMALARTHRLTVYDALYLELALRQRAVLATHDAALMRAASAEGVALA